MGVPSPPPPPPLPPPLPLQPTKSSEVAMKLSSKISPFIQKLQQAPAGYWFEPEERSDPIDVLAPRMGSYFCYGTLMDPALLSEILGLPEAPTLRPAKLVGYSLKLWGQYPALINGPPGAVVEGMVYEVEHEEHAQRLAEYETQAYWPAPCLIRFIDGKEPEEATGTTFKYVGNPMDLSEGAFDLSVWLKRMGRAGTKSQSFISASEGGQEEKDHPAREVLSGKKVYEDMEEDRENRGNCKYRQRNGCLLC